MAFASTCFSPKMWLAWRFFSGNRACQTWWFTCVSIHLSCERAEAANKPCHTIFPSIVVKLVYAARPLALSVLKLFSFLVAPRPYFVSFHLMDPSLRTSFPASFPHFFIDCFFLFCFSIFLSSFLIHLAARL